MLLGPLGGATHVADRWKPARPSVHGLTIAATRPVVGLARTVELDVETDLIAPIAVHGPHRIRVTLPSAYDPDAATRYPVLYLLHGGDGGSSAQWTTGGGEVESITEGHDLIVVMPDGGKVGWYVDWTCSERGPQAWESFHTEQVVDWIDTNLATVAHREGRAIAGLSMGGFGAVHYAQSRPDLFSYVASLSGALSLRHPLVQATTFQQTLVNRLGTHGPFGRPGSGDAWAKHDPSGRLHALADTRVALYAGIGRSFRDPVERTVAATTRNLRHALTQAGIEHRYWTPTPTSQRRRGSEHSYPYWNRALTELLPDLIDHLTDPHPGEPASGGPS